jgi:hypothetical protein
MALYRHGRPAGCRLVDAGDRIDRTDRIDPPRASRGPAFFAAVRYSVDSALNRSLPSAKLVLSGS